MFEASFYKNNRKKLSEAVENAVIVVPANSMLQSSADLAFPFRQDSSFWYLCGIDQPDAVLVLDTADDTSTILLPERSDFHNEWDGQYDTASMKLSSGVDSIDIVKMETKIAQIVSDSVKNGKQIGYLKALDERVEPYGFYSNPARQILYKILLSSVGNEELLVDVRLDIARLRQVKQPCEIEAIQHAIDITGQSLEDIKMHLQSYQNEKDIERALSSQFYAQSDGHAYEPIIAGGKNAAIIHYTSNDHKLNRKELLLLDVGAKYNGYAADISRTWSTSVPTQRQQDIHAHVLDVQHYAMSLLKPGVMLSKYQKQVEQYHHKNISKLGIQTTSYPHGVSHFLGLDVHDAGDYTQPLVEGTVLTVEPGVYLPDEGIGVRIEDDVVVTSDGIKNLSAQISTDL